MNKVTTVRVCKPSSRDAQEASFITGWDTHRDGVRGEAWLPRWSLTVEGFK